ncbi:MAG: 16S rRNA (uracil(1498)-N(3))-methyltransferase [Bacteroidales bacterium]|nr:16S rRNA (uracil(1498)-N(3))-methyltransferase [Bacteroidales bacterium]
MDIIFYCPEIRTNPEMPEAESRHCARVLRKKEGDSLFITDGKGYFYRAKLLQANPKSCIVAIEEELPQVKGWDFKLHIAFAPTKKLDRMEWFVEKATEIGIDRFTPLHCRFSERKHINATRLEKIMVSAMKQSQKCRLPQFDEMIKFEEFIEQPFSGQKFIAHCYNSIKNNLTELCKKNTDTLILIGPEGDFSEEEVAKSIEHGFTPISLGESRLRTETAALVACHTVQLLNQL